MSMGPKTLVERLRGMQASGCDYPEDYYGCRACLAKEAADRLELIEESYAEVSEIAKRNIEKVKLLERQLAKAKQQRDGAVSAWANSEPHLQLWIARGDRELAELEGSGDE